MRPTPGQRSLTLYSAVPIRLRRPRCRRRARVAIDVPHPAGALRGSPAYLRNRHRIVCRRCRHRAADVGDARPAARPPASRGARAVGPPRAPAGFGHVDRKDEIGDLARTLEELTARLDAHIKLLESFAGDVAHEFKNPLASIRVAAEVIASTEDHRTAASSRDAHARRRPTGAVGLRVRELARVDAQLAHEEVATVDVSVLLDELVNGFQQRDPRVRFASRTRPLGVYVRFQTASRKSSRTCSIMQRFAPIDSIVEVSITSEGATCIVSVEDRGPGFPPGHVERVFDRFFSYRPEAGGRREHTGWACRLPGRLSKVTAAHSRFESQGWGASVEVRLPLVSGVQPSSRHVQIVSGTGFIRISECSDNQTMFSLKLKAPRLLPAAWIVVAAPFSTSEPPSLGANGLLHPYRRDRSGRARDLYPTLSFAGANVRLAGWHIPARSPRRGTVVYLHGVADNRGSA